MHMLYVNAYAVTNAYGGPEEGGWTYSVGSPVASVPVVLSTTDWERLRARYADDEQFVQAIDAHLRTQAQPIKRDLAEHFPRTGRRGDVMGGDDFDVRIEREFAQAYPTERPHYE